MGRFIQVALAAAEFAVKSANWKKADSDLDEVGVYVSSGIGGFDIIEREHWKLVQGGPGKISPFFIPSAIVISLRDIFRFATAHAGRIPRPPPRAPLRRMRLAILSRSSSAAQRR